jgi:putative chitinase
LLTIEQLCACFPNTPNTTLSKYLAGINKVVVDYHINTPLRLRAFLAQVGHESGEFKFTAENLNYSADALQSVFKKYFPTPALAKAYARKPEKIANRVYANRMGNGDEASGEGWKYRGRGLIQITGKSNYTNLADALDKSLDETTTYLETPEGAVVSGGWFWAANNLNKWADGQDMLSITKRINGGTNGLEHRMALYNRMKLILR